MELSPRLVAVIAWLALVPIAIYGAAAGELTVATGAFALINVVLIAGSIMVLFGPAPGDSEPTPH